MFSSGGSKIHLVLALVAVVSLVFQVRDLFVLQGQRECLIERLKKWDPLRREQIAEAHRKMGKFNCIVHNDSSAINFMFK